MARSAENTFGSYDAANDTEKRLFEVRNKSPTKRKTVSTVEQAAWVSSHRQRLIEMCTLPDAILDHLSANGFLSHDQCRTARAEHASESKMTLVFELLSKENLHALYHAVKENEGWLFAKLDGALTQDTRTEARSPTRSKRRIMRVSRDDARQYKRAMVGGAGRQRTDATSEYLIGLAESCQQPANG